MRSHRSNREQSNGSRNYGLTARLGNVSACLTVGTRLRRRWIVRTTRVLPSQAVLSELQQVIEDAVFADITGHMQQQPRQNSSRKPAIVLVRFDDLHLIVQTEFAGPQATVGDAAAIAQLGALQRIDRELEVDELQGLPAACWFWLRGNGETYER
jgi:hypothetical protein